MATKAVPRLTPYLCCRNAARAIALTATPGPPGPALVCACLPAVAIPCAATSAFPAVAPACGGVCPAGQSCVATDADDVTGIFTCGCVPSASVGGLCINDDGSPACGGVCPTGMACVTGLVLPCPCR